jgi:hypothetical protein
VKHSYATDSNERKTVIFLLAVISILSARYTNKIFLNEILNLTIPWWSEISPFGFFLLFFTIFDKYLWQNRFIHKIGLIKTPNLNGVWKGGISSSFDPDMAKKDVKAKIHQSWIHIGINLETESSHSHSLSANVLTEDQNNVMISYEYLNEPKFNAEETMHIHRGTCRLTLSSDGQKLNGEYYTGRDRKNFGSMTLTRSKSD